ncbi:MAG: GNAT family N-acetyltransferase [Phycisphaerales bacterium]|nr:MAG: GNAT family N-acetyltransferase [Phycisphaerales bacterium]
MEHDTPDGIRLLEPTDAQHAAALRMVVSGQTVPDRATNHRVAELTNFVRGLSLSIEPVLGVFRGSRLVCACASVATPGRITLVYLPPERVAKRYRREMTSMLRALQERTWEQAMAIAQALVWPEASNTEEALSDAGFHFLAELAYQERPADAPPARTRIRTDLSFVPYSQHTHHLFIQALDLTYVGSLDCPDLTGLRDTEDVLAMHRATGRHDPALWLVASCGSQLAGVLLLSQVLRRPVLEVVYMGVTPEVRGQGMGDALLARAVDECARRRATFLTLAVDSDNHPALGLYKRWGFVETARRRAWIATGPKARH